MYQPDTAETRGGSAHGRRRRRKHSSEGAGSTAATGTAEGTGRSRRAQRPLGKGLQTVPSYTVWSVILSPFSCFFKCRTRT